MALGKHNFKKQMMEKTIENERSKGSGGSNNPKVLPYYKLDFGEKVQVAFIPYEDGTIYKHFKKHGPNMGIGSVGSVECIHHARGESCPACAEGFSHVKDGKATELSKKWMPKDYFVAQVVVIDTEDSPCPFELEELEDGNQARIFFMPFAIKEKVVEAYEEGIVEDPTEHIFVIKKTKNQGGNAFYGNSFFRPEPIPDDVAEVFADDDVVIELHDLKNEKVEPEEATEDEVEEWVEKAREALEKSSRDGGSGSSSKKSNESSSKKEASQDDSKQSDDDDDDDGKTEPEPKKESSGGSSLKEKLRSRRKAS